MSTSLGQLFYELSLDSADFISKLKSADTSVSDLDKSMKSFADKTKETGEKLTTNLTLPILAVGTAATYMASEDETAGRKFAAAFEGSSAQANAALASLQDQLGITGDKSKEFLGNIGSIAKTMGASSDEALAMATQVETLAAAWAAYNGSSIEEATNKVTSAMMGQTKGLKELGLTLKDVDVQNILVKKGQDDLEGSALQLATAQATLEAITAKSGTQLATFKENTDSLSYSLQTTKYSTEEMLSEFGKSLVPIVKSAIESVQPLIQGFIDLDDGNKKLILTMAAFAAAIGPILVGIASVTNAVRVLNLTALAGPAGVVALVGLAVAAFIALGNAAEDAAKKQHFEKFEFDPDKSLDENIAKLNTMGAALEELKKKAAAANEAAVGWEAYDQVSVDAAKITLELQQQQKDYDILKAKIDEQQKAQEAILASKQAQAIEDKKSVDLAAQKAAVEKKYTDARSAVLDVLKGEQTEQEKIYQQILALQATPWAAGKLEDDRLRAIALLKDNIVELTVKETEAGTERLKSAATELTTTRASVAEQNKVYQDHYATIAAALQQQLKDLEDEKAAALKLAEETGASKEAIEEEFRLKYKSVQEDIQNTEKARVASVSAVVNTYYDDLKKKNAAQLIAIEIERNYAVQEAKKKSLDTTAIEKAYAAQMNALRDQMQKDEESRTAELTTLNNTYYKKLAALNKSRIDELLLARDEEVAAAKKAGGDIDAIMRAYAIKETALKNQMAKEEADRQAKNLAAEEAMYLAVDGLLAQKLVRLQEEHDTAVALAKSRGQTTTDLDSAYLAAVDATRAQFHSAENARMDERLIRLTAEKDQAIADAEAAGQSITAIQQFYALQEEAITADIEAKKLASQAKLEEAAIASAQAIQDKEQEYYVKVEELRGNKLIALEAERDKTIAEAERIGADTANIKAYYAEKEKQILDEIAKKKEEDLKKQQEDEAAAEKKKRDENLATWTVVAGQAKSAIDTITGFNNVMHENALADIEAEQAAETARLDALIAAQQALYDTATSNITDLEAMRKEVAGAELQGYQDELDFLNELNAAGVTLTDEQKARQTELQDLIDAGQTTQLDQIDALLAAEKKAAEDAAAEQKRLENEKITMNNDMLKAKWEADVAAFNTNKALAIAKIAVDTASAGIAALPNIVLAGVIAALGIAAGVTVGLQKPPAAPTYAPLLAAEGGVVPAKAGGTQAIIGEGGSPEMILPLTTEMFKRLGTAIVNSLQGNTRSLTPKDTAQTINILMDGKVIYSVVNNGLNNRSIRVPSAALVR